MPLGTSDIFAATIRTYGAATIMLSDFTELRPYRDENDTAWMGVISPWTLNIGGSIEYATEISAADLSYLGFRKRCL